MGFLVNENQNIKTQDYKTEDVLGKNVPNPFLDKSSNMKKNNEKKKKSKK